MNDEIKKALNNMASVSFVKLYRRKDEPTAKCGSCGHPHSNRKPILNKKGKQIENWERSECVACRDKALTKEDVRKKQMLKSKGQHLFKLFSAECPVDLEVLRVDTCSDKNAKAAKVLKYIKKNSVVKLFAKNNICMFHGKHGTGKTATACIIAARSCLEEARPARFINSSELRENAVGDKWMSDMTLARCNFLIIDELGVNDSAPKWIAEITKEKLRRLIDIRRKFKLKTIFITIRNPKTNELYKIIETERLRKIAQIDFTGKSARSGT